MTGPRIYTYKITFEEIPNWYWGVHKEKKYGEFYIGSPQTHAWKWEFYTPHLQICEVFPNTDEGWDEALEVEKRCIKPDLNNPLCLNEHCGGILSMRALRKAAQKVHQEKDAQGRSVFAVKASEKLNAEKDTFGRSVNAVKGGKTTTSEKTYDGLSIHAQRLANSLHSDKDDNGKSKHAVKMGLLSHLEKDEQGKSKHARNMGLASHAKKNSEGESIRAKECGRTVIEKYGKPLKLVDSDGKVYVFESIRQACKVLNLNKGGVYMLRKGTKKSYKGFTIHPEQDEQENVF
jgi:hypothetical protein